MHLKKVLLAATLIAVSLMTMGSFAGEKPTVSSPLGYWKTMDEVTGKPKSIVEIWRTPNQILMGKIVKVFPANASQINQNRICTACEGEQHNQPIIGMVIISGLKSAENQWANGHILDVENGRIYKCTARLTENGKKINVRGYEGLPLFGHLQTWERVDLLSNS